MKRLRRYFDEVWSELKKVSWPTREQVRNLTVLVFAISFVIGLYITVLDQIFKGYDVLSTAALTHGATQTGSKSEMPFEIRVTYATRGTGIGTTVLLKLKAGFELRDTKWVLTSVQSR